MENRIPSTDASTWNSTFKVGDKVKIRIDFSDIRDTNAIYEINSIENGSRFEGVVRPENPSGKLYILSNNGGSWEGKDLELVELSSNMDNFSESKKENLPSNFKTFNWEDEDFKILRVPETPQQGGPPPPETDEPQEPQETPENVENPFDEEEPKPENEDDKNGDGENKDGEDKEPKEGEDKEPKDGQDKEPKDGQDKEPKGGKKEGEGDKGDEEGEGEGEGEEGDFGNTDNEKIDLDELLKKVKDAFEKGNSTQNIQNGMDLEIVERALATSKNNIKDVFKTKAIAKAAIGNRNLFGADNEQKINDVLNEIFK